MKRDTTEVYRGKEVFKNWRFSKYPTLNSIIADKESELNELISVKLSAPSIDIIDQYNIETKRFITNFTNHNGLDLLLIQLNKTTGEKEIYTPYSNPGYNVFARLLLAYFEKHKKRPNIDFSNIDIERRNENEKNRDIPLKNDIDALRREHWIRSFLEEKDSFQTDDNDIYRGISSIEEKWEDREGIWFQEDLTILKFRNYWVWGQEDNSISTIYIENNLIPLYLQAFIDTNIRIAGPSNGANLKKIYEMIFYFIEHPELDEKERYMRVREDTPLTKE